MEDLPFIQDGILEVNGEIAIQCPSGTSPVGVVEAISQALYESYE